MKFSGQLILWFFNGFLGIKGGLSESGLSLNFLILLREVLLCFLLNV